MNKTLIAASAAVSLLAGSALAQSTQPPVKSPPAAAQSQPMAPAAASDHGAKGITMANSATMAVRFVQPHSANIMMSNLIGLNVYNNQNEKLGEIEDVSVENGKTLTGVVVSVGGFLGMNERYVMVDPSTLVVHKQGDDDWKAFVDTSRDNLKNAPKFEYGEMKS